MKWPIARPKKALSYPDRSHPLCLSLQSNSAANIWMAKYLQKESTGKKWEGLVGDGPNEPDLPLVTHCCQFPPYNRARLHMFIK